MRMINLERRKPLDCHQKPLHHSHTFPRQRHLRRGAGLFNSLRAFLPAPPHFSRPFRSFLSPVQESREDQYFDMERKGPTILEPPFGEPFFPSIFDQLRPRRDLVQIRQARMNHINGYPPFPKSPIASRHQQPSSSCHIIPIEVRDADAAPKLQDTEEKNAEDDCGIQITDDEPCVPLDTDTNLSRRTLSEGKSQVKIEDDVLSDSGIELTTLKPVQALSHVSSGASKGKETLIGGANKCHLPPDEAVLVLDDSSSLGQHHKDLAQCQGTSSLDEEVEVGGAPDYPVYMALKKKLSKECRQIDYIRGDGNCFFRAVSKQLYGSEKYHLTIRNLIVDLIATNKNSFAQFVDGEDVQEHVERMCQEQSWATTCEIYAAATLLQRDIFMLTPDHLNEIYSWLLFKPVFQCDTQESGITNHPCYLTMCNTNGNHYDRIVPEHGGCNCFLPHPELDGVNYSMDLTEDS